MHQSLANLTLKQLLVLQEWCKLIFFQRYKKFIIDRCHIKVIFHVMMLFLGKWQEGTNKKLSKRASIASQDLLRHDRRIVFYSRTFLAICKKQRIRSCPNVHQSLANLTLRQILSSYTVSPVYIHTIYVVWEHDICWECFLES